MIENANVAAVECLSEFGQQDSEYTEDYALVTQRQVSSLTEQIGPASVPVPKPRYALHVPTREGLLFYSLFCLYTCKFELLTLKPAAHRTQLGLVHRNIFHKGKQNFYKAVKPFTPRYNLIGFLGYGAV